MGIPENIKTLRERYKLTQDELGKIAGVSGKAVHTWEAGLREPRMGAIQKIADYFHLRKSSIIEDNGLDMNDFPASAEPQLTARDERDIARDLERIMEKLSNEEGGPASFEGEDIPKADREMFAAQLEIMLRRLKVINKEFKAEQSS